MSGNITIIGPRCVGKSTLCTYIKNKTTLDYIEFDDLLQSQLMEYGGLTSALETGKAHQTLDVWAPKVLENIMSLDNILLEIGAGAISSKFLDTNRKNIQTLMLGSHIIPLLPYKDLEKSVAILLTRENARGENSLYTSKEKVKSRYIRFLDTLDRYNLHPIYVMDQSVNEIYELVSQRVHL